MSSSSVIANSAAAEGAFFGPLLRRELSVELPAHAHAALDTLCSRTAVPAPGLAFRAADAAVRRVAPLALQSAWGVAARELEELPPLAGAESCRQMMMDIEKVGRRHGAPAVLFRALGGPPSTLLLLAHVPAADRTRAERALFQVAAAVARVVGLAVRAGADPAACAQAFADLVPTGAQ